MRLNDLPIIMVKCLVFTIIIEILTGLIIGIRDKKDILNVVLVNVLTNPLVVSVPVYLMVNVGTNARYYSLVILEVMTVFVEGFIYSKVLKYKKINPYLIALILNTGSYIIGEVMNRIL